MYTHTHTHIHTHSHFFLEDFDGQSGFGKLEPKYTGDPILNGQFFILTGCFPSCTLLFCYEIIEFNPDIMLLF